ncbi:FliM/FliN family flagellar motor switch protein, partial [Myxococcota bacterium]|nr:FliM/FliN family flagellar motor switch protein [Myxococcota bacterium]
DEGMSKRGEIVEKPELSKRMPVDIIVEAGRLVLKGEELDTLVAGAVLPLGVSPSGQVNLVHDGRIIARGELLVAGDELAVRILE